MSVTSQQWLSLPKEEKLKLIRALYSGNQKADFISLVSAGSMGVRASLGTHFDYAIFGRDSLQVAEDLLDSHRSLVHKIIITLASLQGVKKDEKSEEEPGKIHHEYRSKMFNGQPTPEISQNIMKRLQQVWGDVNSDYICYYGSADATPLYIRLIYNYVKKYGPQILEENYNSLSGQKTIKQSVQSATDWLVGRLTSSPWIMLEYRRLNKESGITNQAWKDSSTSYLHTNGEIANYNSGIASAELQGYAYDALLAASELVAKNESQKRDWTYLAQQLQQQTIERLWMPETKFFAQGLDRSGEGHTRRIETLTSNGAALADSRLLTNLPYNQAQSYIRGISEMIAGNEFMTPAGIRSRALKHKDMPGFIDYHGSYTVWPKETYAISRGLRNCGDLKLADQIESRLLSAVMRAGEFYEFFYVNIDNSVWYDREEAVSHFTKIGLGNDLATPEAGQAWTISAVQSILDKSRRPQPAILSN